MWARPSPADLAIAAGGCAATLLAAYVATTADAEIGLGAAAAVVLFVAAVAAFIGYPHVAVAATIVLFAAVPMLKVLVTAEIGAVKDGVFAAAAVAAAIIFIFDRRVVDRWVPILVLILLGIYAINAGGGHDVAWAQGLRLTGEPLVLLLVGMILPDPRRTFRWALAALIGTACLVAAYGLVQQIVGQWTLHEWGYAFDTQLRVIGDSQLRSFGTLDDPFAYSAFLLYGLAAVVFWLRRGPLAWGAGALITAGLLFGFSRTAAVIVIALAALLLWRRGQPTAALVIVAAVALVSAIILINAGGSRSTVLASPGNSTGTTSTADVLFNGRISAWSAALGDDPADWLLGRGVGETGTAAARATYSIVSDAPAGEAQEQAVDSGYLATVADVGIVGLAVLLALFVRLTTAAAGAARRGLDTGWICLALLTTIFLDAITRASFTGFPTAFLGLLLVGIAISAADEERAANGEEGGVGTTGTASQRWFASSSSA